MENKISLNKVIEILNKERESLAVELVELKDMNIYPDAFLEELKDKITAFDVAIDIVENEIKKMEIKNE